MRTSTHFHKLKQGIGTCHKELYLIFLLAWLIWPNLAASATEYNYPQVKWLTTETEHFVIHYHKGVEWTARKVSLVAETAFDRVTKIYDYVPRGKTHIFVRDLEDRANGFAVWHLNWITIWASNSLFPLRGRHDWIYGTLVHEYAHIVSLQKSAIFGRLIDSIRIGGLEDEDTKANIDVGASLSVAANPAPRWWAEAVAQLDTANSGFAPWDSHQDMLLRAAILEDNTLSFDEMHNIRVRQHFGAELLYNQGFNFITYLSKRFGSDVSHQLAHNQRRQRHLDFEKNFKELFKVPARKLYDDWLETTRSHYQKQVAAIQANPVQGRGLQLIDRDKLAKIQDPKERAYKDGLWNFDPRYSPDGHFFAYVSQNKIIVKYLHQPFDVTQIEGSGTDVQKALLPTEQVAPQQYGHRVTTMNADNDKGADSKSESLEMEFSFKGRWYSFSPEANYLVLSRRKSELLGGYPYYDLYLVDLRQAQALAREYRRSMAQTADPVTRKVLHHNFQKQASRVQPEIKRLSHRLRAIMPSWSPDGARLAFVTNSDGTRTLQLATWDDEHNLTQIRPLTDHGNGAQALDPTWSADGRNLAYQLLLDGSTAGDIWLYDFASKNHTPLLQDAKVDFRDPTWSADGRSLYLSGDLHGIFQIYRFDLQTRQLTQISNVTTGAFHPFFQANRKELLYSRFSSFGFKLFLLQPNHQTLPTVSMAAATPPQKTIDYPKIDAKPYRLTLRPLRLFPTLIYEDRQPKAGFSLQLSDYHEEHNLFAGAVFGQDQDYTFSYRNRSWYVDLYVAYSKFIRFSDDLLLIDDGDGVSDEPQTNQTFDINFVTAALIQRLYPTEFLRGEHEFSLSYNLRFVDSQLGIPLLLDPADPASFGTDFNLITNHGVALEWRYSYFRDPFKPQNDVNPRGGRELRLAYSHVWSDLSVADSSLDPAVDSYDFNRFVLNYTEYVPMPGAQEHTFEIRTVAGYIDRDVNVNDEFFAGGRLNFRAFGDINANSTFYGYEDFSIRGETLLLLSTSYRFPLLRNIAKKTGVLYLDSLYSAFFVELGNVWNHGESKNCQQVPAGAATDCSDGNVLLADIGAELRLKAFLFNDFNPWNSILRLAYGFQDSTEFGFSDDDLPLRFFLGIGTDF